MPVKQLVGVKHVQGKGFPPMPSFILFVAHLSMGEGASFFELIGKD
jgi:hypothetical protein